VDDIVIEVNCRMIVVKSGADVDIGANPSTEEQEEALEDGAKQVNDVVYSFRLQPTTLDKKGYLAHLKVALSISSLTWILIWRFQAYMKKVKEALAADGKPTEAFESGAQAYAKKIIGNYKDYECVSSLNLNP
jgi:hypothetical protein